MSDNTVSTTNSYSHFYFRSLRLLETELQRVSKNAEVREKDLRHQIDDLKSDNERQQKLIGQVRSKRPPIYNVFSNITRHLVSTHGHHAKRNHS